MPYIIRTLDARCECGHFRAEHGTEGCAGCDNGGAPVICDSYAASSELAEPSVPGRAVATLEEARGLAVTSVENAFTYEDAQRYTAARASALTDRRVDCDQLPEAGGTIGPLPDGTVIEVAPIGYLRLAVDAGFSGLGQYEDADVRPTAVQIIDAYNAARAR